MNSESQWRGTDRARKREGKKETEKLHDRREGCHEICCSVQPVPENSKWKAIRTTLAARAPASPEQIGERDGTATTSAVTRPRVPVKAEAVVIPPVFPAPAAAASAAAALATAAYATAAPAPVAPVAAVRGAAAHGTDECATAAPATVAPATAAPANAAPANAATVEPAQGPQTTVAQETLAPATAVLAIAATALDTPAVAVETVHVLDLPEHGAFPAAVHDTVAAALLNPAHGRSACHLFQCAALAAVPSQL